LLITESQKHQKGKEGDMFSAFQPHFGSILILDLCKEMKNSTGCLHAMVGFIRVGKKSTAPVCTSICKPSLPLRSGWILWSLPPAVFGTAAPARHVSEVQAGKVGKAAQSEECGKNQKS